MDTVARDRFLLGLRDRTSAITAVNRGPLSNIQATLEEVKDADAIQKSVGRAPSVGRYVETRHHISQRPSGLGSPPLKPPTVSIAVKATGNIPLHQLLDTENVPPDKTPRSSLTSSPRRRKPDHERCFGRNQQSHFGSKCPLPESPKGNGRQ